MKDEIKMIPIDRIRILNFRHRDRKKFELIVQSIKNLGLKRPIQVSLRSAKEEAEGPGYDLVFGQGRILSRPLKSFWMPERIAIQSRDHTAQPPRCPPPIWVTRTYSN